MYKKELIFAVARRLVDDGVKKTVPGVKHQLFINDGGDNETCFTITDPDRNFSYLRSDVEVIINTAITIVLETLRQGDHVSIQELGTLGLKKAAARSIKIPAKDEYIEVPEHHVPKFKPGKKLFMAARLYDIDNEENQGEDEEVPDWYAIEEEL